METIGLLEEQESRLWNSPVRNLDIFFTDMYYYFNTKGLPTIMLTEFCALLNLGFTAVFSIFLIGFVNWSKLRDCHDEVSCGSLGDYIIYHPFTKFSFWHSLFIIFYSCLLGAFWSWRLYRSYQTIQCAMAMEAFYRVKLGIYLDELQSMNWDDVLRRLIDLHDRGTYRVAVKDKLTEIDVVMRIMRKDNFMISFINQDILDLRVPWWATTFVSEKLFLTKNLEWSLSLCVMEFMFDEQFNISAMFLKDVAGLQGRFILFGVCHLALLPFMLIFMIVSFFLQNAQQFHSSRAYLGPRQWSPLAVWTFREFNELPHVFDERINKSYAPANEYISLFYSTNGMIIARSASYIAGAFVATLLLTSVFAEGALLYVDIGEHNLLWWLGIFSAVYAGARSLIPDDKKITSSPEEVMNKVNSHTHYFPNEWMDKCHTTAVKDAFSEMFPYKIHLFAMEVMSVILTPIVLCFSLPNSAQNIVNFVKDHTEYVEGIGAVCDFSKFEFARHGNVEFGAPENGYEHPSQRPKGGKLEKSFMSFQAHHPYWEGADPKAKEMVNRVKCYRAACENQAEIGVIEALQQSLNMGYDDFDDDVGGDVNPIEQSLPHFQFHQNFPHRQQQQQQQQQQQSQQQQQHQHPHQQHRPRQHVELGPPIARTPSARFRTQILHSINEDDNEIEMSNSANLAHKHISFLPQADRSRPVKKYAFPEVEPSLTASQHETGAGIHPLLRSLLLKQNVDVENDFYWQTKFQQERVRNPQALEKSLQRSMSRGMFGNSSIDNSPRNFFPRHSDWRTRRTNAEVSSGGNTVSSPPLKLDVAACLNSGDGGFLFGETTTNNDVDHGLSGTIGLPLENSQSGVDVIHVTDVDSSSDSMWESDSHLLETVPPYPPMGATPTCSVTPPPFATLNLVNPISIVHHSTVLPMDSSQEVINHFRGISQDDDDDL